MNKPINPNVQIPPNFAVNGQKADFTQQKIQNGFNMLEPDILAGDNLNKFIDDTYKSITYSNAGVADLYRSAIVYDAAETYYQNSIVFNVDLNGEVSIYLSKANDNVGNSLSNNNYWEKIQLGTVRNIGEIVHSVVPLTDAGLHLLDGGLISGTGIYKEFVDYIAGLYIANPNANYFATEVAWQSSVTTYGVCGKFVYDSVNNTVRLPKITGIIEGTIDATALGDLVQAGLPNITAAMSIGAAAFPQYTTGAFTILPDETLEGDYLNPNGVSGNLGFNANLSNPIYGRSNTVQPQTIKAFVYIVVATSVKTDIQADIDEIATDLNGKAGTDLVNVNNSGKSLAASWAMPSNATNISNLTPVNNQSYTATTGNGQFYVLASIAPGTYVDFYNITRTINKRVVNMDTNNPRTLSLFIEVVKGDNVKLSWNGGSNTTFTYFKFIPCIGG